MTTDKGYKNIETERFVVETENREEFYNSIHAIAEVFLRRVPSMTDQTLGANIKLSFRTWVDMAQKNEPIRNLGWADDKPVTIPRDRLIEVAEHIGDLSLVSEDEIGASWRETLTD